MGVGMNLLRRRATEVLFEIKKENGCGDFMENLYGRQAWLQNSGLAIYRGLTIILEIFLENVTIE